MSITGMEGIKMNPFLLKIISFIVVLVNASCVTFINPVEVTKTYLNAITSKDANQLSTCSSAEWEEEALEMLDTFTSVDTILEDLACRETQNDGIEARVICNGKIIMTYNNEDTELDLSKITFVLKKNNNEWLIDRQE
ncbi:MAG: hypothetical protein C0410_07800 [Anaerolinea sp.]|nr:hypothetical protein [Anaerolinea sp.]